MNALRVGAKAKKVRGKSNVGLTGTIVEIREAKILSLRIKIDTSAITGDVGYVEPGSLIFSSTEYWEPLIKGDDLVAADEQVIDRLLPFLRETAAS